MNLDQRKSIVDVYIDLRSPYSYLAIQPARELEKRHAITLQWWPFITDFQSAYGGEVEDRKPRDVAKLKYLYMDCRRLARSQGLTIRATTKLWNPSLASQAMLFARSKQRLWEFCDPLLAAFWRREFDLESLEELTAALVKSGLNKDEWQSYVQSNAVSDLDSVLTRAEQQGVFGAPTFVWNGDLYWGGDRLPLLDEELEKSLQLDSNPI